MKNPVKILVVDDDPTLRLLNCLTLNSLGFMNLCEAEDGEQALEVLMNEHFGLVLSDIRMPNMDGFELLRSMGKLSLLRHTPIVMLTSESRAEDKLLARSLGASAYLLKSVNKEELRSTLTKVLGR